MEQAVKMARAATELVRYFGHGEVEHFRARHLLKYLDHVHLDAPALVVHADAVSTAIAFAERVNFISLFAFSIELRKMLSVLRGKPPKHRT
jgi:hypothetical protein